MDIASLLLRFAAAHRASGGLPLFVEQRLQFFHKGRQQGFLALDRADDLAFAENYALVAATGQAQIRFAGFAQPMTATLMSAVDWDRRSSTARAKAKRSISVRPQVGQEMISGPRERRPRARRISQATATSSAGSAVSETRRPGRRPPQLPAGRWTA